MTNPEIPRPLNEEELSRNRPKYLTASPLVVLSNVYTLHASLEKAGHALEFVDHMTLTEGRSEPAEDPELFGFVPILPYFPPGLRRSFFQDDREMHIYDEEVVPEKDRPGQKPWCDGTVGLGYVYKNRLVALCVGGLAVEGPVITQIQDVSLRTGVSETSRGKSDRKNGLHYSGIDWKLTLTSGWLAMVSQMEGVARKYKELPRWIQSAQNNYWVYDKLPPDYDRYKRLYNTYDRTAQKLGGEMDATRQNYRLPN